MHKCAYIVTVAITVLGLLGCTVYTTDMDKTTFAIYNNTDFILLISKWDSKGNVIYDSISSGSTKEKTLRGDVDYVYYDPKLCLLKPTEECIEYVGETKYEYDIRRPSLYQKVSGEEILQITIDSLWWEASRQAFGQ